MKPNMNVIGCRLSSAINAGCSCGLRVLQRREVSGMKDNIGTEQFNGARRAVQPRPNEFSSALMLIPARLEFTPGIASLIGDW